MDKEIITKDDIENILTKEYFDQSKRIFTKLIRTRNFLKEKYKTLDSFLDSLELGLITNPGDPKFRSVYDLYDSIFTLPDEKESLKGFETVLGFNTNDKFLKKFGSFEETFIYALEPESKKVIGAVNFAIYEMPSSIKKHGIDGTNQVIYLFVKPEYRTIGVGQKLLEVMENYSRNFLDGKRGQDALKTKSPDKEVLIFCEQNAPKLMTLLEYLTDNVHAKIDQCNRLQWWDNRGYKQLDFKYVQPPLDEDSEPCTSLTLNVKSNKHKIPSKAILAHLNRFFEMSVLKNKDPLSDESYIKQKEYLEQNSRIKLIKEDYGALRSAIAKLIGVAMFGFPVKNIPLGEVLQKSGFHHSK